MDEETLSVLAVLNFLYGVGRSDIPIFPNTKVSLGPGQGKDLRHLWGCVYALFERGSAPFSLNGEITTRKDRASVYVGGTVSVRRKLVAAKFIPAWPKAGHIGSRKLNLTPKACECSVVG